MKEVASYKSTILSNINYFPKGLIISIKDGSRVKTKIIAKNIARPVNIPK